MTGQEFDRRQCVAPRISPPCGAKKKDNESDGEQHRRKVRPAQAARATIAGGASRFS
jgi:hypothetical protein